MVEAGPVRLVVADVDGTLVTPDKELTQQARAAVRALLDAGITFTITSGRPPRGMAMLIEALQLRDPIVGPLEGVPCAVRSQPAMALIHRCGVDPRPQNRRSLIF